MSVDPRATFFDVVADPAPQKRMTADEYLAWEREQMERHEFLGGEIFSMAGGSPRHNTLIAAVTRELGIAFRGGACRVFSTDQRIVARDQEHYVYADASVVCGKMQLAPGTNDVLANPTIVVEVLSKRTEAYDRGLKWDGYQRIPSVTDYVLVSQTAPRIEHFQREASGEWHYRVAAAGGVVTLANGTRVELDAIYAGAFELEGE
jgi:Uma2 family endonuclease